MYRLPAGCGVACFVLLTVGGYLVSDVVPEWVAQLTWIALATVLSAVCGYRDTRLGWQAGAVIMGIQLACFVVLMLATGELIHPSSSTGGLVGLFIGTTFVALVSPIPILFGQLGSWARRFRTE
jgi:hypothetical protein